MSCKSMIFVGAPTTSTITTVTGSTIQTVYTLPLGDIQRGFGCDLNATNNAVQVKNPGYYNVDVAATVTPAVAGLYQVGLYLDGQLVPGTLQQVTAVAGAAISFGFPAAIRIGCCGDTQNLTLGLTTDAAAASAIVVNNTALRVTRD